METRLQRANRRKKIIMAFNLMKVLFLVTILAKINGHNKVNLSKPTQRPTPQYPAMPDICNEKYRYENSTGTPDYMYSPTPERMGRLVRAIIPPMRNMRKGGKVIVLGGSMRNPGALYRTSMAAVRLAGPEKVITITTPKVTPYIMGYGPDLTVYPYMFSHETDNVTEKYEEKYDAINSLFTHKDIVVIGPSGSQEELKNFIDNAGLGSTEHIVYRVRFINNTAGIIFTDEGGIRFRTAHGNHSYNQSRWYKSDLEQNNAMKTVVVCNYKELRHVKRYFEKYHQFGGWIDIKLPRQLISFVMKGKTDYFMNNNLTIGWSRNEGGTGNRAAGQGDIFAGVMAVFLNWAIDSNICGENDKSNLAESVAAYAAAAITRRANELGVQRFRHGMTSTKMLRFVWKAFVELFVDEKFRVRDEL